MSRAPSNATRPPAGTWALPAAGVLLLAVGVIDRAIPAAVAGVVLSAVLAMLVVLLARSRARLLEANAALVASEERLRSVIEGSSDGYLDIDLASRVTTRSDRWWEVSGWSPGEVPLTTRAWLALVHPEDVARVGKALGALRSGAVLALDEEYRQRTRTGAWRWLRARAKVVRLDAAGRPTRLAGTLTDIDARRERDQLALDQARLHGLSGRMNEAELVFGLDERILEANDRALELYGRSREELVGHHVRDLRAPSTLAEIEGQFLAAADGGLRFTTEHLRRDGTVFPVEVSSRPFEVGNVRYVHSLVRDLTEQRRQQAELRLHGAITRSMRDAIIVTDLELRILCCEGGVAEVLGWTEEELRGTTPTQRLEAVYVDGDREAHLARLRAGQPSRVHTLLLRKDGARIDADVVVTPLPGAGGEPERLCAVIRDISAAKAVERALRASEDRFRAIFEHSLDGILLTRTDGVVLAANPAATRLFGRTEAELKALGRGAMMVPDVHLARALVERAAKGTCQADLTCLRADGTTFVGEVSSAVFAKEGALELTSMIVRDVTERRRLEEALRESEERVRSIVASMAEGVVLQSAAGAILSCNAAAERFLGLGPAQLEGRTPADLARGAVREDGSPFPEDERPTLVTLRTGRPVRNVVVGVRDPEGQLAWLSVSSEPLRLGPDAAPYAVVSTFADVTAQVEAQRRLETASAELAEASRAATAASRLKSQFLANMSHEIRTPLNGIIGLSQLALEETEPAQVLEYVDIIHRSGTVLLGLINDILDVSKIEAGRMTLEARPFDLGELLASLEQLLAGSAQARGLTLRVVRCSGEPGVVVGDALRVRQVLTNLLSNAIKFTPAGGQVELEVASGSSAEELRFTVSDTGIGMDAAQLAQLFQPFTQGDASTTRRFGGTGLGLSISRQLARLMGGELLVESTPGRGSTFRFNVRLGAPFLAGAPQEAGEADGQATSAAARLEGRRVLLVEDNRVNQFLARKLLEKVGMRVTLAENGQEAVERATASAEGFDAILMDIQMPELDGYQATRAIRDRLGPATPPIIAMTAHAMSEERDHCLAAGMVAHLAKPIEVSSLYSVLAKWMPARPMQSPGEGGRSNVGVAGPAVWPDRQTGGPAAAEILDNPG
jgi:two-component system, sensor histidine kinase and response regulator